MRREKEDEGKIYPPFLILEYGELTPDDIGTNTFVQFIFSVDFYMDNDILHIIDVSFLFFIFYFFGEDFSCMLYSFIYSTNKNYT